jgi:hypothetical protein
MKDISVIRFLTSSARNGMISITFHELSASVHRVGTPSVTWITAFPLANIDQRYANLSLSSREVQVTGQRKKITVGNRGVIWSGSHRRDWRRTRAESDVDGAI